MTQMLLFDAPSAQSPITPVVALAPRPAESVVMEPTPVVNEHRQGLNHMGDLARLVLLRHDLAAARRAKRAGAKRASAK